MTDVLLPFIGRFAITFLICGTLLGGPIFLGFYISSKSRTSKKSAIYALSLLAISSFTLAGVWTSAARQKAGSDSPTFLVPINKRALGGR